MDKRKHCGCNVYTGKMEDITLHKCGAPIFYTADKEVWDFVNHLAEFNHFINAPLVKSGGELYTLPFNMNTFYQLWGVETSEEAIEKIKEQQKECFCLDI